MRSSRWILFVREVGIGIVSAVLGPLPPGGATYAADIGVRR